MVWVREVGLLILTQGLLALLLRRQPDSPALRAFLIASALLQFVIFPIEIVGMAQGAIFAGKLIARVGLATNKPAEFIILRISQDTRALEAELAAAEG